jgi:hypothetical protein
MSKVFQFGNSSVRANVLPCTLLTCIYSIEHGIHVYHYQRVLAEVPKAIHIQNLEIDFSETYGGGVDLNDFLSIAKNWIKDRPIVTCLSPVMPVKGAVSPIVNIKAELHRTLYETNSALRIPAERRTVQSRRRCNNVDMWVWQAERGKLLVWKEVK